MNKNINLGNNIRDLRKKYSLSQEDLAKKIGSTKQLISEYERGNKIPNLYNAIKIASFFNCSLDSLIYSNTDIDLENLLNIDDLKQTQDLIKLFNETIETVNKNQSEIISNNKKLIKENDKLISNVSKMISRIQKK